MNSVKVAKHSVPIAQMSNYNEVLNRPDTLRTLTEDKPQPILFGNPFRKVTLSGGQRVLDETEEEGLKSFAGTSGSPKRKTALLATSPNKRARRTSESIDFPMYSSPSNSPAHSPPSSPVHSPGLRIVFMI